MGVKVRGSGNPAREDGLGLSLRVCVLSFSVWCFVQS